MFFKQYYLGCLSQASYLIGDEATRTAVVVDPQRDVDEYLADAAEQGFTITHVFLTHFHADFVAGHLELRDRVGAAICLGGRAEAEFPIERFPDGRDLTFGNVRVRALETPGHTPEGITLLVFDLAKSATEPYAALTGDTLFIGDVGRPDLMASVGVTADELANMLYDSLQTKILPLPDETLIYPAHGAGSLCGRSLSNETFSTMAVQRQYNYALQPMSRDEFVTLVTADQPEAPAYFIKDAMLNRQEHPTLDQELVRALKPLSLGEVLSCQASGATLLDVREANDFEAAHLSGSLDIGLGGPFATWAGTLLEMGQALVLVAEPGNETEAAVRLGRIGFHNVLGYLDGGMAALAVRPDLVDRVNRLAPATAAEELAGPNPPFVVDVRAPGEFDGGHVDGAVNIPLNHLRARIAEIPRDRPVLVHCQGGYRSGVASSILRAAGYTDFADLAGGYPALAAVRPDR